MLRAPLITAALATALAAYGCGDDDAVRYALELSFELPEAGVPAASVLRLDVCDVDREDCTLQGLASEADPALGRYTVLLTPGQPRVTLIAGKQSHIGGKLVYRAWIPGGMCCAQLCSPDFGRGERVEISGGRTARNVVMGSCPVIVECPAMFCLPPPDAGPGDGGADGALDAACGEAGCPSDSSVAPDGG